MHFRPEFFRKFHLGNRMTPLTQDSTDAFLSRFYSFYDSVIRRIELTYEPDGSRILIVSIAVRDSTQDANEGWVCVNFRLMGVSELGIRERANQTLQVLCNGLHLRWFGPSLGIDFGTLIDPPESMDELRMSDFFAASASASWGVGPY